jgi:hypothetical protein
MRSNAKAEGRFGKQDFVYVAADDFYRCPAGERLTYTNEEDGKTLRRYWTTACQTCALKAQCTTGRERRISRWEHEAVLETVQARLDQNPDKMRVRRRAKSACVNGPRRHRALADADSGDLAAPIRQIPAEITDHHIRTRFRTAWVNC